MGGFMAGLGQYAKSRLMNRLGSDPNQHLLGAIYRGMHRNPQSDPGIGNYDNQITEQDSSARPDYSAEEGMASGKMVTHPTIALLGEHGPEAVVPMDGKASNKISPGILSEIGMRSRYRTRPAPLRIR